MARRTNSNNNSLASVAAEALALSPQKRQKPKREQKNVDKSSHSSSKSANHTQSRTDAAGDISGQSSSGDDDVASGSEDAEASSNDEEEEDDGGDENANPAVIALSGRTNGELGGQAGHVSDEENADLQNRTAATAPVKKSNRSNRSPRRNSQFDSDDDDYNGVDAISDSDEEDPDVEQLEERNIIESEEADSTDLLPPVMMSTFSDATSTGWEGFDYDDELFIADAPYFDEQYGRSDPSVLASEMELFNGTGHFEGFSPPPLQLPSPRRVRFMTPVFPRSDTSDVVSDDEDIEGLFRSRQEIDMMKNRAQTSEAGRLGEEDERSSRGSSSGYETDYGDTTDEEDVPVSATTRPQSLLRRPSLSSFSTEMPLTPASTQSPFKIPATPASCRVGPRLGTFRADPRKPVAIIDGTGENMVIYPAKRPQRVNSISGRVGSGYNSSAPSTPVRRVSETLGPAPEASDNDYSDFASQMSADPVLSSGPDMSIPGFLDAIPKGQRMGNQSLSPSSVFFPVDSLEGVGVVLEDDNQDCDDNAPQLTMEDFVDFGESSSDDGGQEEDIEMSTAGVLVTPKTTSTTTSSTHDLLRHFDTGVITAFRRGQPQQHHVPRRAHNGLGLSGHAIKGGRHAAANTPLSPQKKRKMSENFGARPSYGVAAKRRLTNHR